MREPLDRQVVKFTVGSVKVLHGEQQGGLGFLESVDTFIDLVDSFIEVVGRAFGIDGKAILEAVELGFKVRDVEVLVFDQSELSFIFEGVFGGISDDADEW